MAEQFMVSQRTITATQIRRNFGAVVQWLRKGHEHAVVQKSGIPVAVLLPMAEYEQLLARRRQKVAFHDFARNLGRAVEKRGLSEEAFMAELEQTKRQVFAEQYAHPT